MKHLLIRSVVFTAAFAGLLPQVSAQRRGVTDVSAGSHPFVGGVIKPNDSSFKAGIYTIPSDGTTTLTMLVEDIKPNGGGVLADGKYHSISYRVGFWGDVNVTYKIFDAETWENERTQSFSGSWSMIATDMAYNALDGGIYGCFYTADGKGYEFGTLDVDNRKHNLISTIETANPWYGVAVAPDGTVYAVAKNGMLMTVDKTDGTVTVIGDTGLSANGPASAAIDPKNGRMYYSHYDGAQSAIYEIDRSTASATQVAVFAGSQFVGLNVPMVGAEASAPAPVSGLAATFPGNSLDGTLSFDAPSTTADGNQASGDISYSVKINGVETLTGTTAYGATVSVPVTLPAPGSYEFAVTVSKDGEPSEETTVTCWAGDDVPQAPTGVVMKLEGNTVRLSWTPVTAGEHGGYVNASEILYAVTRYPGGTAVVSEYAGCEYTESLPELADGFVDYYYTVTATASGMSSAPAESNRMILGAVINPPYLNDFSSADKLDGYTCLNPQDDTGEVNWKWDSGRKCVYINWTPYRKMNAWLISPRIRLEVGKVYPFAFDAAGSGSDYTERVEAFIGRDADPAAMQVRLSEPVELTNPVYDMRTVTGEITVSETGIYYIGIHGCSDEDMYRLYVDNLTIGAGARISAPGEPENLVAIPDPDHLAKATVSFVAPQTDIDNNPLDVITRIELSRDGNLIKTFDSPQPGAKLSHTDTDVTEGFHTYSVVAFNNGGAGKVASATVFVGVALPTAPTDVSIEETATPGELTVSWSAPLVDVNGNPLKPGQLTYTIRDFYDNTLVAEGISGESYTWQAVTDRQTFKRYKVFASTAKGMCDSYAGTPRIAAGPAFRLPVNESFADARFMNEEFIRDNSIWAAQTPSGSHAVWQIYSDGGDVVSHDGDNAFSGSYSEYQFDEVMLYSGKIDLTGAANPTLVFHYWVFYPDCNNLIDVKVNDGSGFRTVKSLVTGGDATGWAEVMVPLGAYAGKTVQIAFNTRTVDYSYVVVDNISVADLKVHDLAVSGVSVPARMHAGREEVISVRVENRGIADAEGYVVELYCNDVPVQEIAGPALAAGAGAEVRLVVTPPVTAPRTLRYHAVISYDAEEYPDDNVSAVRTASLVLPPYPAVDDLTASSRSGEVSLEWSAPDTENTLFSSVTDDFEGYSQFVRDTAGKWSFIDGDGSYTHGFGDALVFPGMEMPMAYTVFNNSGITTTNMFEAHPGHQYMASFAATSGQNDDWMISPELKGVRQSVTFWAKTYAGNYGNEEFEFLYSTSGKDRGDFVKIGEDHNVPVEWTEYEYSLPEGARYFAIRCVSRNRFIFFVDDVTYIPAGASPVALEILGYNVYRDGTRLNDDLLTAPGYVDRDPAGASCVYGVSTVYDAGESALSNLVTVSVGLDDVGDASVPVITAETGNIIVTGATDQTVTVHDMSGRLLSHNPKAPARLCVPMTPGVYVVSAGGTVARILVR